MVEKTSVGISLSGMRAIVAVADELPPEYPYGLQPRVEQLRRCVAIMDRLKAALHGSDEAEIVAAWYEAVADKCEGLVKPKRMERIDLAQRRLPLIEAIHQIPHDLPAAELDRRLLEIWQDDVLEGCAELADWRPHYQWAAYRRQLLQRLEEAIGRRDDTEIVAVMAEDCLAGYPIPAEWLQAIHGAQARGAQSSAMLAALGNGDPAAFVTAFDARLIRQYRERFEPYQPTLCQWTETEVAPVQRIGLRPAVARSSLLCVAGGEGPYQVRWSWPAPRFSDRCILAVLSNSPGLQDDPRTISVFHRVEIDRQQWEGEGASYALAAEADWAGAYVVVWALLDVGFRVYPSHPLVLGRLEEVANGAAVRGWKGWLRGRRGTKTPLRSHPSEPSESPQPPGEQVQPSQQSEGGP
jgi:hypothetical protein